MFDLERYKKAVTELMEDDEFALDDKKLTAVRQTKESVTKKRNILGFSGMFGLTMAGLNVAANVMDKDIPTPAIAVALAGLSVAGMKFVEYRSIKREEELLSSQNYKILNRYLDNKAKEANCSYDDFEDGYEQKVEDINDLQADIRAYNAIRTKDIDYQDYINKETQVETTETSDNFADADEMGL